MRLEYTMRSPGSVVITLRDDSGNVAFLDTIDPAKEEKRSAFVAKAIEKCPGLEPEKEALDAELLRIGAEVAAQVAKPKTTPEVEKSRGGGEVLTFEETEPWENPVDGEGLADEIRAMLRRFVVLPPGGAELVTLWVAFSHVHDAFDYSPLLLITSPTFRCGKSRLLSIIQDLVPRPLASSSASASSIFRSICQRPTILADEADAWFDEENGDLLSLFNSGHDRGQAFVTRTETVGGELVPMRFSAWAPKVLAMIGKPQGRARTILDRSVVIEMQRRAQGEEVERLRIKARKTIANPLRRKLARWALDNQEVLAERETPWLTEIPSDRDAENFGVLLGVADAIGGHWPETAREVVLTGIQGEASLQAPNEAILRDIRKVFAELGTGVDRIASNDLCARLCALEESTWSRGKNPLDPSRLAAMLAGFKLAPKNIKFSDGRKQARGYRLDDFRPVFSRYLVDPPLLGVSDVTAPETKGKEPSFGRNRLHPENNEKPSNINQVTPVAPKMGYPEGVRQKTLFEIIDRSEAIPPEAREVVDI